jgi:hypothetical protein
MLLKGIHKHSPSLDTTIKSCVAAPATARIGDTGSGLLSPNNFGDQNSVFSASLPM